MKTLRIFISSPGDVLEERELARKVIEQLRRRYAGRLDLKAVLWEDMPLGADTSFTEGIDLVLSETGVDIAVFILWSRLGSPTGAFFTRPDGTEYRSGTEREFDLMLSARRQSGGKRPHILVYARADESTFEERLRGQATDAKSQLLDQKRLVEGFIREEFQDPEGRTNIRAYHSFDRPQTFSQRLRVHLAELLDCIAGNGVGEPLWNMEEQGPPFLGLAAYQFEHAAIFFGREDEIVAIRQALREQACRGSAFVLISGASGSGKSSLARAGVLPAVVENEIDDAISGWRHAAFTPGEIGGDLIGGLAQVLCEALPALGTGPDAIAELAEGLATNPELTFKLRIKGTLAGEGGRQGALRIILLVDQIEELFTDARIDDAKRAQFASVMEAFARSGSVWIVATVRSDFSHHCQGVPALVRLCEGAGRWDLLQPTADAIGRVIREPARLAGLSFETRDGQSLADRILRDAVEHRELMPLLSHVLRGLCAERTQWGMLSFAAYEKSGGVQGSLANHAEATFQSLPPESQHALPALLTELVTLGGDDGSSFVRRRPTLISLSHEPAMRLIVERFIAARLLTAAGDDASPDATATLAHEALMRVWDRIRDWASANREHLRLRARIEPAQERWQQQSRHPSLLLTPGLPLEEGRGLLEEAPALLSPGTREYIEASIAMADAVQTRRRRIRRCVTTALSLLLVAALIASAYAWQSQRQTAKAKTMAEEARNQSDEILTKLQLQRAEELFDTDDASGGLAYLAAVLRKHPGDQITAARLLSALRDRSYARPLLKPLQHAGSVIALAWSPDGKRLVTLTKTHIYVWDPTTGLPVVAPIAVKPESGVLGVNFSKDGRRFVVIGVDSQIFDSDTGQPVSPPLVHVGRGFDGGFAVFFPDGKLIATATYSKEIKVWDVETGKQIAELKIDNFPEALAVHPDGVRVAVSTRNGKVILLDSVSQHIEQTWNRMGNGPGGPCPPQLIFSPDGSHLFEKERDVIVGYDLNTNQRLPWKIEPGGYIHSNNLSPDGRTFVVVTDRHAVRLYSAETGEYLGENWRHSPYANIVKYGANGTRMLILTEQMAQVRTVLSGIEVCNASHVGSNILCANLSDDGMRLAVGTEAGEVRVWEIVASESQPMLFGPSLSHPPFALSADESLIATSGGGHAIVWNFRTGRQLGIIDNVDTFWSLNFHPGSEMLLTGGVGGEGIVRTWDARTGRIAKPSLAAGLWGAGLNFSADGKLLLLGPRLWDFSTGKPVTKLLVHKLSVTAITPDGKRGIAVGPNDNAVKVIDLTACRTIDQEARYEAPIKAKTLCADGRMFAAGSSDGGVRVWRTEDASPITPWLRHQAGISSISFSLDGSLLATSSLDQTVRIWSIPSGKPICEPIQHARPVQKVQFCPDGKRVATYTQDGDVRIYDAQTGRPLSDLLPVHTQDQTELKWTRDSTHLVGNGVGLVHSWEVPAPSGQVPAWLADWAEAVAGQRIAAQGRLERLIDDESAQIAAKINALQGDDLYTRTARWFYAKLNARPISPDSKITQAEYAKLLCESDSYKAVKALLHFVPGDARVWARYAELVEESPDIDVSADEIRFLLSHAESLNPKEPWVWRARALIDQGDPDKEVAKTALPSLCRAADLDRDDWRTQRLLAFLLAKRGDSEAAISAANRALANMHRSGYDTLKRKALIGLRMDLLQKAGRFEEAAVDNREIHLLDPRDPKATPQQVDLTAFYNLSLSEDARGRVNQDQTFEDIPHGLQTMAGTLFDIRGTVQLKHRDLRANLPDAVRNIRVAQTCTELHFLHSLLQSPTKLFGPVAAYLVTYEDGTTAYIPVHGSRNVGPIYRSDGKPAPAPMVTAWMGQTAYTRGQTEKNKKPLAVLLYKMTWHNPHPEKVVKSLDFVSADPDAAPALFAITAGSDSKSGELDEIASAPIRAEIEKARKESGPESWQASLALLKLFVFYRDRDRFDLAEPVSREALRIREKADPNHHQTWKNRSELGEVLANLGRFTEAESLLLSAYEGIEMRREQIKPGDRSFFVPALRRIVAFYAATKQADKVAEWKLKLAAAEEADRPATPPPERK